MTHHSSGPGVAGRCFVLTRGDDYIGCVRVQQVEFYGTVRAKHHDAMLEARKLATILRDEHVITGCLCRCLAKAS